MIIAQMLESDGPGGAELLELRLAGELRARGHTVVPVGPAVGVGWLPAQFRAAGFEARTFTLRRPLDWRCLQGMVRMLRHERVEMIHSHEFTMAVYGTAAARLLGVPHVISMHGSQYVTARWRRRVLLRWAFRNSAAAIAVSADTKRHLDTELGLRPDAMRVVRNGVPARAGDRAVVRAELGLSAGQCLCFAAGSLVPRKGHAVLINALATVDAPWVLAIAGQGIERDRLLALAADRGVADRVHLLGQRDDVPNLLAAADVFVMPSLWEGLPLALLEAMLAGLPVVASRTAGIPEAVTDGADGLLVVPGDAPALAGAMTRVLSDAALRARLGAAARQRAQASFTLGAMTDAYESLYRAARGGQPRPGLAPTGSTTSTAAPERR
jgi:glycosyltransferase involved in cell wall biosynthesis